MLSTTFLSYLVFQSSADVIQFISFDESVLYCNVNNKVFTNVQMVKLYMFSPVSGLYSCPLAMTDGAAKTIRV